MKQSNIYSCSICEAFPEAVLVVGWKAVCWPAFSRIFTIYGFTRSKKSNKAVRKDGYPPLCWQHKKPQGKHESYCEANRWRRNVGCGMKLWRMMVLLSQFVFINQLSYLAWTHPRTFHVSFCKHFFCWRTCGHPSTWESPGSYDPDRSLTHNDHPLPPD